MLHKDPRRRPTAEEVENHIWFTESVPKTLLEDPNLVAAILSICREKVKTKKIKKEKEMKEILSPAKKVSKVRAKFLLMREEELETYCSSMISMVQD
jgi:hypothetical protein